MGWNIFLKDGGISKMDLIFSSIMLKNGKTYFKNLSKYLWSFFNILNEAVDPFWFNIIFYQIVFTALQWEKINTKMVS